MEGFIIVINNYKNKVLEFKFLKFQKLLSKKKAFKFNNKLNTTEELVHVITGLQKQYKLKHRGKIQSKEV